MVHEKKFQTLETLYQKYLAFERAFSSAIWNLQYVHSEYRRIKFITTDLALLKDFEGGYGKLEECIDYLDENRIFLPDSMATEIRTMFVNSSFPHTIIRYISELNTNQKEEFANAVNEELPNAKFNLVSKLDVNDPDLYQFLTDTITQITSFSRTLESLYKSSADIN